MSTKSRNPARLLPMLPLLAAGYNSIDIGREQYISPETVRQHLRGLYWLLGVHCAAAAVSQGYRRELLDPETGQLTDLAEAMIRAARERTRH